MGVNSFYMQVKFAKHFRKKMNKLPKPIQDKFWERMALFLKNARDPLLHDHALSGEYIGCRSINVTGSYRAMYRHEGQRAVRFLAIGTHPELYGK